jgi:cytochrome c-type biogenesis protein CcmH
MLAFYIFSALLICFALCLLLYPLLRTRGSEAFNSKADDIRRKLATIDELKKSGAMDTDAHSKAQRELSDHLLQALQAPHTPSRAGLRLAVSFLALLPLAVMGIYALVGKPSGLSFQPTALAEQRQAPSTPTADSASAPAANTTDAKTGIDLSKAAEGLQERLKANPDDGEGWRLLGRTYMELGEPAKAADALKNAVAKLAPEADLFVQYGEAIGLAARPGLPPPEAEKAIDQGLALNPSHQNGLWLKGIYRRLDNDANGAVKAWESLMAQMPPGDAMTAQLQEQINQAKGMPPSGESTPASAPLSTPAASTDSVANVDQTAATNAVDLGDVSINIDVDITPELRAKIGTNDVLFVFARASDGPPMPLAVHRQPAAELSDGKLLRITLTQANAMMPTMTLAQFKNVVVGARISKSGQANASSGDFQALSDVQTQPIAAPLRLTISQVLP